MEYLTESFRADWETLLQFAPKLLYAGILVAVAAFAGGRVGNLVAGTLRRIAGARANLQLVRHLASWGVTSVGILLALGVLGFQGVAASVLATGGVAAIVAGFAFREIGENFLAGFFLSFSRPFELQDLIKTGELTGTVAGIELRHVHIRTADACDVFVPSAQIFREPLYNYTRDGLRRSTFTIDIAYHDHPQQVLKLLESTLREVPGVLSDPPPCVAIKEFAAQTVQYELLFMIDLNANSRGLIGTGNDVKIRCWQALRNAGMTFSTDVSSAVEIRTMPELEVSQKPAVRDA
ncbi:MAG: mechanosensitive ion channel [Pseudomonadales bacterium]